MPVPLPITNLVEDSLPIAPDVAGIPETVLFANTPPVVFTAHMNGEPAMLIIIVSSNKKPVRPSAEPGIVPGLVLRVPVVVEKSHTSTSVPCQSTSMLSVVCHRCRWFTAATVIPGKVQAEATVPTTLNTASQGEALSVIARY